MRFLRGVTLGDNLWSEKIGQDLDRAETVGQRIERYRVKWLHHIRCIAEDWYALSWPLRYHPQGLRSLGRSRRRWFQAETGNVTNPQRRKKKTLINVTFLWNN